MTDWVSPLPPEEIIDRLEANTRVRRGKEVIDPSSRRVSRIEFLALQSEAMTGQFPWMADGVLTVDGSGSRVRVKLYRSPIAVIAGTIYWITLVAGVIAAFARSSAWLALAIVVGGTGLFLLELRQSRADRHRFASDIEDLTRMDDGCSLPSAMT